MLQSVLSRDVLARDPIQALSSKQGRPLLPDEIESIVQLIDKPPHELSLEKLHDGCMNQAVILSRADYSQALAGCKLENSFFDQKPTQQDADAALVYVQLALRAFPNSNGPVGLIAGSLMHASYGEIGKEMIMLLTQGRSLWEREALPMATIADARDEDKLSRIFDPVSDCRKVITACANHLFYCAIGVERCSEKVSELRALSVDARTDCTLGNLVESLNSNESVLLKEALSIFTADMSSLSANSRGRQLLGDLLDNAKYLVGKMELI